MCDKRRTFVRQCGIGKRSGRAHAGAANNDPGERIIHKNQHKGEKVMPHLGTLAPECSCGIHEQK